VIDEQMAVCCCPVMAVTENESNHLIFDEEEAVAVQEFAWSERIQGCFNF
jgi:hypothetical protein